MIAPNRTLTWLAAGLLLVMTGRPAMAGSPPSFNNFAGAIDDFEWFAPPDVSSYGDGPQMSTGFFFQAEALCWTIQGPDTSWIGVPPPNFRNVTYNGTSINGILESTSNNADLATRATGGGRFEFGYMNDQNGWEGSVVQLQGCTQTFYPNNAGVLFDDPQGLLVNPNLLPLPTIWRNLIVEDRVDVWTAELLYVRRFRPTHHDRVFELLMGARYIQFDEKYNVTGYGSPVLNTVSSESQWDTDANNHIIGPELGLRIKKKTGRWMLNAEGRFVAGFNQQSFSQQHQLMNLPIGPNGVGQPRTGFGDGGYNSATADEFSPVAELRLELRYQLTNSLSAHVGWNGMWMDGIARAPNMVKYEVPYMGFNMAENRQDVLIQGISVGFDFNR